MDFGSIINLVLTPFALFLRVLYEATGNYGIAITLFCLAFKVLLFPISIKGRKGMLDMSKLSDKQKQLQQKCGDDKTRYNQELEKLYEEEGINPSSGCLWSFLPLPILFGLYAIIRQPMTYMMGLTKSEVVELSTYLMGTSSTATPNQLAMAQPLYERFSDVSAALPDLASKLIKMDFSMFGLNLSHVPGFTFFFEQGGLTWANIGLFLIPIISAILAVASSKVSAYSTNRALNKEKSNAKDPNAVTMNIMMPLMSLWICFTLPAALGVYWIANGAFTMLQELLTMGSLKKYVEQADQAKIERKERKKEEEKEARRLQTQQREDERRIRLERRVNGDVMAASRIGIRTYARGRNYDPERYPITAYSDPDQVVTVDPNEVIKGKRKQKQKQKAKEAKAAEKAAKKAQTAMTEEPVQGNAQAEPPANPPADDAGKQD